MPYLIAVQGHHSHAEKRDVVAFLRAL